jgi:hypothetical protein
MMKTSDGIEFPTLGLAEAYLLERGSARPALTTGSTRPAMMGASIQSRAARARRVEIVFARRAADEITGHELVE